MEKIMPGHLIGFESVQELEEYEEHIWRGGAMSVERYNAYNHTPDKSECDRICKELSGEVTVYNIKMPLG